MPTKTINISACKEHKYQMPNQLELSVGFQGENALSKCSGCVNRGFIWDASVPRHTFLKITSSQGDFRNTVCYCNMCAADAVGKVAQDLVRRVVAVCPCNLCNFDNTQEVLNSPEPLTICFCAFPSFNVLGKISRDLTDYEKDEYTRKYKGLSDFDWRNK